MTYISESHGVIHITPMTERSSITVSKLPRRGLSDARQLLGLLRLIAVLWPTHPTVAIVFQTFEDPQEQKSLGLESPITVE